MNFDTTSYCDTRGLKSNKNLHIYNFKIIYVLCFYIVGTADGGTVVKVLCYKSEGRWFDSRWCHWNFSLT
jgi:hypothetical protein